MANGHKTGGRKAGTPNRRTACRGVVEAHAAAAGVTPLQVMLENMTFFSNEAEKRLAELLKSQPDRDTLIASLKTICSLRQSAQDCARDAAPYVHPRLSAIEANVGGEIRPRLISAVPLTEEEWLAKYGNGANAKSS